eukprot:4978399-Amphidinium_carterae.1
MFMRHRVLTNSENAVFSFKIWLAKLGPIPPTLFQFLGIGTVMWISTCSMACFDLRAGGGFL